MKERPILFNDDMVRAILDGRKTQTRRIVKPQPSDNHQYLGYVIESTSRKDEGKARWGVGDIPHSTDVIGIRPPYGKPGDRLWVREAWAEVGSVDPGYLVYRATYPRCLPAGMENVPDDIHDAGYRWTPSIHMPRWASRITLEITDVRVERLQDMSDGDCWDEGVEAWMEHDENLPRYSDGTPNKYNNIRQAFAAMWDSINGRGSWDENPWVWVVEFPRSRA